MASLTKSIEVNVPVRTAYNQWTQFESFPQFMEGVKSVQQMDNKRLHWTAEVAGKEKQWDAVITDQVPDQKIAWKSTSGAQNDGIVTFQPLGADKTRVNLQIDYDPEGIIEETGDKLGFVSRRVEGDLERFKKFIESRGQETGAWRGTIKDAQVKSGQAGGQQ